VSRRLEELDWSDTPMGELTLRRRRDPVVGVDVFEVRLGEDFLMSSLFTAAEIALSRLALAQLDDEPLDVVVGGLGLGYTATAALEDSRVRSLLVVERLAPVIDWHERGLIPAAVPPSSRVRLVNDDFFAMAAGNGFDPGEPQRRFHAILLDVDHSPRHLLNPAHAWLYTDEGADRLHSRLVPGGVFALWSNDPPDASYLQSLQESFDSAWWEIIEFDNPLQSRTATNTIYLAHVASAGERPFSRKGSATR
jgi:spermidine synthase